jgi:hypothetical protein
MLLDYKHANEIISSRKQNKLWLGDFQAAEDLNFLKRNNIKVGKQSVYLSNHSSFWV